MITALLISASTFFDLQTKTLEGAPLALSAYKGKVVLAVNTASQCGYTPQYEGLEKLHRDLSAKGLVIVGFPSNDFGGQEPGDAKQIRFFCRSKYDVSFPLTEKVKTRGPDKHPVYTFLTSKHGEPQWNFHKYLVGKDGSVLASFESGVDPSSSELRAAIERALKQP